MDIGAPELIIILVVVMVLFGGGRIAQLGGELGAAIHEFRAGLHAADETNPFDKTEPADES